MQSPFTFFFAFIVVLALIGAVAWGVRRFANNRLGANPNRGRMPRLAVIDAAAVDGRRRLVLVRRDNIEHLLMIGGPTDIVVESNIVRATPARDQVPQRPPGAAAELPPRIAPLPDAGWSDGEPTRADVFDHPEPQMPEPPPRPVRPSFADEMRRPGPPPPERRPDRNDPLAGFAPEPMGGRPELRLEPRPDQIPPRMPRTEPMVRPQRAGEPPKPPPVRAPERVAAPPPPPPPPPAQSSADQNLAEMAQRLEAALRRPAGGDVAPSVAPESPPARPPRTEAPAPPAAPPKSGFENLEDEMASLLGRPKNSS
ncbi:MAG TPA: flagellar biosynthetic protein FliO [Xanthobacteraceae bacterium]|nr:flagellar biosynthetic protein FliO [Xanthobacteraceae bacterium]